MQHSLEAIQSPSCRCHRRLPHDSPTLLMEVRSTAARAALDIGAIPTPVTAAHSAQGAHSNAPITATADDATQAHREGKALHAGFLTRQSTASPAAEEPSPATDESSPYSTPARWAC